MTGEKIIPPQGDALRQRAEEIFRAKTVVMPADLETRSPEEVRQLVHDLQVQQIELEMQSEELRRAQGELEEARARYFDLYDLAPVGYFTLSERGLILEANLTAANMLGMVRSSLVKKRLTSFIIPEDQDIYYRHRKQLFETGATQICELRLVKKDGAQFWAHITAAAAQDNESNSPVCRTVMIDITERRRVQEALFESEKRYREFFATSRDCVFITTIEGKWIDFNDAALEMFNYDSREELSQVPISSLYVNQEERSALLALIEKQGYVKEQPVKLRRRDGTVIDVLITSGFRQGADGPEREYYGTIRDITERKQAKEARHRSEENFRRSLDESPLGVRIVTVEGETIYANRAILDIYGYDSVEELKNTPVEKRYSPKSYVEFQTRREQRRRGFEAPSDYVISIIRKDGGVRHLQVFRKEVLWDGESQFQALYHDITERKKAEEALRQSEEKYREIFDKTVEGIYRSTSAGRLLIINPAFARICGYASPEEMMEKVTDIANQLYANPEDRLRFQKLIAAVGEIKGFEAQFKHPTKGLVWISIHAKAIRDDQGNIQYYEGTIEDITDRRRVEEELRASQKQLRDLAERQQQVREEERIMIAREIHDELGGGLTGLKMDLSWLLTKLYDAETDKVRTAMMSKVRASNKLINKLILVVRRVATDLRPSILDDLGLIAALEWQVQEFTDRTEIQHEFATAIDYVNLEKTTSTAVFRIFQEALTNVSRHSRATKVVVVLRESDKSLFGDENLILEIRDNGRGITEEEILNPESLGLLGMKERVLAFGGELSIRGEPGGGTALTLKIPRIQGDPL
ncbi:MAG: PAS domain S-box protein [Pseudomonadota bacterium]